VKAKPLGGVAIPGDLPATLFEHTADMHAFDIVQALGVVLGGAVADATSVRSER
jgi:hypothetical protein